MKNSRFTEYIFKNGATTKNRVVVPPMASQTADDEGFVTKETLTHYKNLEESGAGIVFAEYSFIHSSGKGELNQLGINSDLQIKGLSKISKIIKKNGALAGIQLVHVGGKTSTDITGEKLMGPSSFAVPVKGHLLEVPIEMGKTEIQNWINWFLDAVKRAELAGFDIVELHAAHGYGLNQWLSPLTNKRSDVYGGDISGRSKLFFEIVKEIKINHPKILLAVRLPAQDHLLGGLSLEEMNWVSQELEKKGVDLIDVSSGIGGWRRPKDRDGEGYLVADAEKIKSKISVPVIGVGGIKTGTYIDCIINCRKVDFAAVGRAVLKDPSRWGLENL